MAIILPQSVGMLVGASFFAFRKAKLDRYVWRNMASGLLWGIGNICMLLTVKEIGLAIGFSLSQMGIIISTLGGIFLLGERKTKKRNVLCHYRLSADYCWRCRIRLYESIKK